MTIEEILNTHDELPKGTVLQEGDVFQSVWDGKLVQTKSIGSTSAGVYFRPKPKPEPPVSDTLAWHSYADDPPKEEDGDKRGLVLYGWSDGDAGTHEWWYNFIRVKPAHWMKLPPLPAPAVDADEAAFEAHCSKMDTEHPEWLKTQATSHMAVAQEFWRAALAHARKGKAQ